MNTEPAQQDLRTELIQETDGAIGKVRDLVARLNEREKEYLRQNSPAYRQTVDAIRHWTY